MSLVFQYGSNMSSQRLNSASRLKGDAKYFGIAHTVDNFELVFDVWSKTNRCAAADIVPGSGTNIWGILYDIPEYLIDRHKSGSRKSLDEIEGECTNYERVSVDLVLPDGSRKNGVWTYVGKDRKKSIRTSLPYVKHIMCGLRQNKVPEEYVEYVKRQIIGNNPSLEGQVSKM